MQTLTMLVRFAEGQVGRAELAEAVRSMEEICDVDDEAASSALYSFRTLHADGAESAGWAAETAYNPRDRIVVEQLQVGMPGAEEELMIRSHPLERAGRPPPAVSRILKLPGDRRNGGGCAAAFYLIRPQLG